jgi:hypothetical protein
MKAKEKAKELVLKFAFKGAQHEGEAKKFALIAVDEIIELAYWEYMESMGEKEEKYWQEVKQEINNL